MFYTVFFMNPYSVRGKYRTWKHPLLSLGKYFHSIAQILPSQKRIAVDCSDVCLHKQLYLGSSDKKPLRSLIDRDAEALPETNGIPENLILNLNRKLIEHNPIFILKQQTSTGNPFIFNFTFLFISSTYLTIY